MKRSTLRAVQLAYSAFLSMVLIACGGGGGGSTGTTTTSPTTGTSTTSLPVTGTSTVVTTTTATSPVTTTSTTVVGATSTIPTTVTNTVPVVNTDTVALTASFVSQIGNFRASIGLPAYAHDLRLDRAALNHSQYILNKWYLGNGQMNPAIGTLDSSGRLQAHVEEPTVAGFTGVTVTDRAVAAGYPGQAGEDVTTSSPADAGRCVSNLINTVYHRLLFTGPGTDIGAGVAFASDGRYAVCTLDSGLTGNPVPPPIGWAGVYPYPGQSDVPLVMTVETPDPAPSIAIKGAPVSIHVATTHVLTVATFTLTVAATGAPVQVKVLTAADSSSLAGQAFMVPVGSLASGTQYLVAFQGMDNGVLLSKSWAFTTR